MRNASGRVQALVLVLVFGVLGGSGYLAYSSFASTLPVPVGLYGCAQRYLNGGYLAQGASNNGCVLTMQRFLIQYAKQKTDFKSKCNATTYYPSGTLTASGDFGSLTYNYVKCYQLNAGGLVVDGKPGYNTFNKMSSRCDYYKVSWYPNVNCIL